MIDHIYKAVDEKARNDELECRPLSNPAAGNNYQNRNVDQFRQMFRFQKDTPSSYKKALTQRTNTIGRRLDPSHKYVSAVYYANWSVYKPVPFLPNDIDFQKVTHVYYAFMVVDGQSGRVGSHDAWADYGMPVSDNPEIRDTSPGCIMEFLDLKMKYGFKFIMSIGGWNNREDFRLALLDDTKLDNLASTAVELMFDNCFDGIDLDFEFPDDIPLQSSRYLTLVERIRDEMDFQEDQIFEESNNLFELSVAAPGFRKGIDLLDVKKMDEYLTYWNMMTYDYYGSWSTKTGYQGALFDSISYGEKLDPERHDDVSRLCGDDAITYMIFRLGISPDKILYGISTLGRSFTNVAHQNNTKRYVGETFTGVGKEVSGEEGVIHYKDLPLRGSVEGYDDDAVSAYCYNGATRSLVTYDNHLSVLVKAKYIQSMQLGGAFIWDIYGDKYDIPQKSLLSALYSGVQGKLVVNQPFYSLRLVQYCYLLNLFEKERTFASYIKCLFRRHKGDYDDPIPIK